MRQHTRRSLIRVLATLPAWLAGCAPAPAPPATAPPPAPTSPTTASTPIGQPAPAGPPAAPTAMPLASATTAPAPLATAPPVDAPTPMVAAATPTGGTEVATAADRPLSLVVTNSAARHLSFVDPDRGVLAQVEVGAAPWGLALTPDGRAYATTTEGVAVVELRSRRRLALVPYERPVGPPQFGEYRPGGMGIAAAPDGRIYFLDARRHRLLRLKTPPSLP